MSSQNLTENIYQDAKKIITTNDKLLNKEQRLNALECFKALGVPTKKVEDYKYCNLSRFLTSTINNEYDEAMSREIDSYSTSYHLIFNNGSLDEKLTVLSDGVTIKQVDQSYKKDYLDAMEALCDALSLNYTVEVEENITSPLTYISHHYSDKKEALCFARVTIIANKLSESEFVETFTSTGEDKKYVSALTTINMAAGSKLTHQKVIIGDIYDHYVSKVEAYLKRDARLNSQTMTTGPNLVRNNIYVAIEEQGAHATVNGLYATRSEQLNDNFSHIDHIAPHTTSEQIFKGVLDDASKGAFTGKIFIHRDAQQVDSTQLNKNLLLDKRAHIDTRPQLEVYADDVKCAHGATIGQISEEEVFYLESRGIEKVNAQKILCHAFAKEVLNSCDNSDLTKWLDQKLFDHFERYALEKIS
jgi:Fe-S cluster assembly protein SufD